MRQVRYRGRLGRHQRISRILSRQHRPYDETIGNNRRQILHRMCGKVDAAAQQRLFDLLGEQTLAANLRQISVLDSIARRDDWDDFDTSSIDPDLFDESLLYLFGLDDREPRASAADPDRGRLHVKSRDVRSRPTIAGPQYRLAAQIAI